MLFGLGKGSGPVRLPAHVAVIRRSPARPGNGTGLPLGYFGLDLE
jgi:hypothetical protein